MIGNFYDSFILIQIQRIKIHKKSLHSQIKKNSLISFFYIYTSFYYTKFPHKQIKFIEQNINHSSSILLYYLLNKEYFILKFI